MGFKNYIYYKGKLIEVEYLTLIKYYHILENITSLEDEKLNRRIYVEGLGVSEQSREKFNKEMDELLEKEIKNERK